MLLIEQATYEATVYNDYFPNNNSTYLVAPHVEGYLLTIYAFNAKDAKERATAAMPELTWTWNKLHTNLAIEIPSLVGCLLRFSLLWYTMVYFI